MLSKYAGWLDWNFYKVIAAALWFLFIGFWIAVPALAALKHGGMMGTPVVIPGRSGTSLTVSLLFAGILTAGSLLLCVVLLVSCCALWLGILKQAPDAQQ